MIQVLPIKANGYVHKAIQATSAKQNSSFNNVVNSQFGLSSFDGYRSYIFGVQNANSISFGAKPVDRDKELHFNDMSTRFALTPEYRQTVQEAYEALGKKNVALICHGASFPSAKNADTGYGTCNSQGALKLMGFLQGMFNTIQLGPQGMTKPSDASPYASTSFSLNILTVDLKSLTEPEWERLLSDKTYNDIVKNNPNRGTNRADHQYAIKSYNKAFEEVWKNFNDYGSQKMKAEFEQFKKENHHWLESDALYEALSKENGNDYWKNWANETDRNLFDTTDDAEIRKQREQRKQQIKKDYSDLIGRYEFVQFVASKQIQNTKANAEKYGMKMIADRQVAFSHRDVWANKSVFLPDWKMGCPPDMFSQEGQAWDFDVLNPDKIFDEEGNLGDGGKLLYSMFLKIFKENKGGVRIDHIIGLIDPWWYKAGGKPNQLGEGAGRAYSTPPQINSTLGKHCIPDESAFDQSLIKDENGNYTGKNLDNNNLVKNLSEEQINKYARIINKIVIKAANEAGLDKNAIIAEDLGTLTYPVEQVMKRSKLNGIRVVQFVNPDNENDLYRCKNIDKNSWATTGTHDNSPIWTWAQNLEPNQKAKHVRNLCEDLYSGYENREEIERDMLNDSRFLATSKLVELFASKAENVQISFMDIFGYTDAYNVPGVNDDTKNWNLGLGEDFQKAYQVKFRQKAALNLPFVLSCAIRARGQEFADKNRELLDRLDVLAFGK